MNKEVFTKFWIDSAGDLQVERTQDAQDIADRAAMLRDQPQFGADFHHRWSAPNTLVESFYKDYCGTGFKPMDQEFWEYMHKRMKDPQYSKFWTHNNSFFTGYNGRPVQSDV
jgi:hypothetical protein